MTKFHVNTQTGNTGECDAGQGANARGCPFGGQSGTDNHFDSLSDAEAFRDGLMIKKHGHFSTQSPKRLKNKQPITNPDTVLLDVGKNHDVENDTSPIIDYYNAPHVEPVTMQEVSELVERSSKYLTMRYALKPEPLSTDNVLAYSMLGSVVYGLNHDGSDRDVLILTDIKYHNNFHKVYDDGADVRIVSMDSYINSLSKGNFNEVDLLKSGTMVFENRRFDSFFRSFRFNEYKYVENSESHAISRIHEARRKESEEQGNKLLRTAFRNLVLAKRVAKDGQYFDPTFTPIERAKFYNTLELIYAKKNSDLDNAQFFAYMHKLS